MDKPKARYSFWMGPRASLDALGNISPNFMGPILPPVITEVPDLDAILQDVPEVTKIQIT